MLLNHLRVPHKTEISCFLQYHHNDPLNILLNGALEFSCHPQQIEFSNHYFEQNPKIILTLIGEEKLLIRPTYFHKIMPSGIQAAYDGLRDQPDEFIGVIIDWR